MRLLNVRGAVDDGAVKMKAAIFYVYEHIRPDTGEVFYVGKGKGPRASDFAHRRDRHKRIRAKLDQLGLIIEVRFVAKELFECDAFILEKHRIAYWREVGNSLINHTDSGEGASGLIHTEASRAAMSDRRRAMNADPEFAAKHAKLMREMHASPAYAVKHAERSREQMLASNTDPEFIAKRAEGLRMMHADPAYAAKRDARASEQMRKMNANPEHAAKCKTALRAKHADPEFSAKHKEASRQQMLALNANPEFVARNIARTRAMNADPEFAAHHAELARRQMLALHANPEFVAKHSARVSEQMRARHARRRAEKSAKLEEMIV